MTSVATLPPRRRRLPAWALAALLCLAVLTVALVAGSFRTGAAEASSPSPATAAPQVARVSVHLRSDGDLTALEVLERSDVAHEVQGEGANAFVTAVAGYTPADDEFWALYLDGVAATVGAGSATVRAGDVVEWRLEGIE